MGFRAMSDFFSFCFFFQAEDGIRDKLVTGVQTCALPIFPHRRARRGHHSAFWILTAVVVSGMVVGLVSLNAMRVDAAYRTRYATERVRLLADERRSLVNDVARLSSPSRIGTWARARGLVSPAAGDVVILQVSGASDSTSSTAEVGG